MYSGPPEEKEEEEEEEEEEDDSLYSPPHVYSALYGRDSSLFPDPLQYSKVVDIFVFLKLAAAA